MNIYTKRSSVTKSSYFSINTHAHSTFTLLDEITNVGLTHFIYSIDASKFLVQATMMNPMIRRGLILVCKRFQLMPTGGVKSKIKEVDAHFRKIGDETTEESQKTMRTIRRLGVGSIGVAVVSLILALKYVLEPDIEEIDEIKDFRDVRK